MSKLYRSRRDRWISGLLGGLGEYFGISTTALRILAIISIPFTGGTTIFIYLIAALVVSKEPYPPYNPYYNGGWQGGGHGYGPQGPQGPQGYQQGYQGNPQFGGYSHNRNTQPPHYGQQPNASFNGNNPSNLDSMMKDIEKKAMKKELDELREKLAKYEKGEV